MGSQEDNQNKNDVHASIAISTIKMKKENDGSNKQLSRRCASQHQNLRLAHHPFFSTMPLMPLPWNSSVWSITLHGFILIHGCNIIFYIMREYYQITIHLVSYIVANTKGPKYFIAILFVYFGYTCFNGWILHEPHGKVRYLTIVLRNYLIMAGVEF